MNPSTRGNGRIFKPDNSRFWHAAYYHNGKEIRESTHVEFLETDDAKKRKQNENEALAKLREKIKAVQAERAGGPSVVTPEQKRVTINQLLDGLKVDYEARHKWNRKVECLVKPLRAYFGHGRACNLTKTQVMRYMVKMQGEGYKDSTVNRRVQLLLQSFTLSEREAPHVPRLSEIGNERRGFFERADFLKVVEHLPGYLRDYARFAYVTGWRKGAVSSLEWVDVETDKIVLRAINSKNRRPVTVPIVGEIAEIVARQQAARILESKAGEVVFSRFFFHRGGRRIGDIRKSWDNACRKAGVGERLFHDLRRTAARNLVQAGVPESVAQNITGHVTNSMFKRYSITSRTAEGKCVGGCG